MYSLLLATNDRMFEIVLNSIKRKIICKSPILVRDIVRYLLGPDVFTATFLHLAEILKVLRN